MIKLLQCIDDLSDGMKASLLLLLFPIVLFSTILLNILAYQYLVPAPCADIETTTTPEENNND